VGEITKRMVLIVLLTISLTACGGLPKTWPELQGLVLEHGTNEPIEGVFIVAKWKGSGGIVDHQTICYHVEAGITDIDGFFVITEYNEELKTGILGSRHVLHTLYKPGYEVYTDPSNPYRKNTDTIWFMKKYEGTSDQRFIYYKELMASLICSNAGESKRNAYPLHREVYYEAIKLAETDEQKETAEWLRRIAAGVAVSPANYREEQEHEERREIFLRENLK